MADWVKCSDRIPKLYEEVDLWIEGNPNVVAFYDPAAGRCSSGRTCSAVGGETITDGSLSADWDCAYLQRLQQHIGCTGHMRLRSTR
jgi:hypothetical protein